jgi:hypothetical protein
MVSEDYESMVARTRTLLQTPSSYPKIIVITLNLPYQDRENIWRELRLVERRYCSWTQRVRRQGPRYARLRGTYA